mmetsp:Transcript_11852/g.32182  ORF Transcript_11852/g.32182 Transcript_11852/m.32182 type:complete len:228 (+) Transcript_11852:70-753(+)|eukprot:CAMPEP_0115250610 /NCGR_PEP_ID=MMETSP0270-20121206/43200_1 /TAXON_ID=71861 /ORGANISM="Scrippsiella trochoidea, Strain CCMP3099" /LENGTH=227 /DNA_ID=CAMNT_0002665999 /DNA_START=67 /DNA_END=750 /DNA_ORIENTATION=-
MFLPKDTQCLFCFPIDTPACAPNQGPLLTSCCKSPSGNKDYVHLGCRGLNINPHAGAVQALPGDQSRCLESFWQGIDEFAVAHLERQSGILEDPLQCDAPEALAFMVMPAVRGPSTRPSGRIHCSATLPKRWSDKTGHQPAGPALGMQQVPSIGSQGHAAGTCRPCIFFHTKGCENAKKCRFCHLCGPGALKDHRKERRKIRRDERSQYLAQRKEKMKQLQAAERTA